MNRSIDELTDDVMALIDTWKRTHIYIRRWRFWLIIPKGWQHIPLECSPGTYQFKSWQSSIGFWRLGLTVGWRFGLQESIHYVTGVIVCYRHRTLVLGILHSKEELKQWLAKKPKDDKGYMKAWGIK